MKNLIKLTSLAFAISVAQQSVHAAGFFTSPIDNVAVTSNGWVLIRLTTPVPATINSCGDGFTVVTEADLNTPGSVGVLSMAQLAVAKGRQVTVKIEGCNSFLGAGIVKFIGVRSY